MNRKQKIVNDPNFAWFKDNYMMLKNEYNGQWVAIGNQKLIAHGNSFKNVYTIAKEKGCRIPFITKISPERWETQNCCQEIIWKN